MEKATPKPDVIQYAAAVLKGQPDLLEAIAPCFVSDNARIRKHKEGWILESSEFASCTTGEQVFPIADDIVARIHGILALYCGTTPTISVEHIYWIDAACEPLRSIRGSISVNVISSKGLAELQAMRGTQPLGSAVYQSMILDAAVGGALTLHGEGGISWPRGTLPMHRDVTPRSSRGLADHRVSASPPRRYIAVRARVCVVRQLATLDEVDVERTAPGVIDRRPFLGSPIEDFVVMIVSETRGDPALQETASEVTRFG